MTNFLFKTTLFTLLLTGSSCKSQLPIETKSFVDRNNPEHTFHYGINQLKDTIVSLFNFKNQYENKILSKVFYYYHPKDTLQLIDFNPETASNATFGEKHFSQPNTSDDIYLHDFGDPWLSKLYFSGNQPLKYVTAFVIKLKKMDDSTTKVQIVAEEPKVFNGISGYGPHGGIARETAVQPTTIEEYSLLLFIADKLGDTTLQPLKLPSDE